MTKVISIILLTLFFSTGVKSEEVKLNCVTSSAQKAVPITIDLDKKAMYQGKWSEYRITRVDDNFITAMQLDKAAPGGTIFVINRKSGEYTKALVGKLFKRWQSPESATLKGKVHEGRCSKRNPLDKVKTNHYEI